MTQEDDEVEWMIACTGESMMAGRRALVAGALRAYGTEPVTEELIEATLAQVNAAFRRDPLLAAMKRDSAARRAADPENAPEHPS